MGNLFVDMHLMFENGSLTNTVFKVNIFQVLRKLPLSVLLEQINMVEEYLVVPFSEMTTTQSSYLACNIGLYTTQSVVGLFWVCLLFFLPPNVLFCCSIYTMCSQKFADDQTRWEMLNDNVPQDYPSSVLNDETFDEHEKSEELPAYYGKYSVEARNSAKRIEKANVTSTTSPSYLVRVQNQDQRLEIIAGNHPLKQI